MVGGIYMSHPVNTEILESLFEEQIDAVQKDFPPFQIGRLRSSQPKELNVFFGRWLNEYY